MPYHTRTLARALLYRKEFLSECQTLRTHDKQHHKDVRQRKQQLLREEEQHRLHAAGTPGLLSETECYSNQEACKALNVNWVDHCKCRDLDYYSPAARSSKQTVNYCQAMTASVQD